MQKGLAHAHLRTQVVSECGVELYCTSAKCMNIGSTYVALLESTNIFGSC